MWYVVQTRTGEEEKIKQIIEELKTLDKDANCFIPTYEGVKRKAGHCRIYLAMLFPGYIFVDTSHPERIMEAQSRMTEFVRLLGVEKDEQGITITPVSEKDRDFIETLVDEKYLMHVSLVKMNEKHKIEVIDGPLEKHSDKIVKVEYRKRRAIIETEMFGKKHRILFGLWGYEDPKPVIEMDSELRSI